MIYHLYRRPKRNGAFWMDLRVNGCRYREPLGTRNKSEAGELMLKRVEQLKTKAPDPAKRSKSYGMLEVAAAIERYSTERAFQVSPRTRAYWEEQARPLVKNLPQGLKLKQLSVEHLTDYQNARLSEGRAPKTINGEVSVLRQVLTHAKLWYRFEDYKPVRNHKPPTGRALTEAEQSVLFTIAKSRSDWLYAYTAAVLGAYCGMRACEIRALQWKDVDFTAGVLDIRRSKTPAGWRAPTMNTVCRETLSELFQKARSINAVEPEHYVFPWHGREQKIEPTRPITSWRSAWRSILRTAGIQCRFHDLRHTAVTVMAEKGLPEQTIMAQVGHISPQMMKTYSHIRRLALNAAAAALEPSFLRPHSAEVETVETIN